MLSIQEFEDAHVVPIYGKRDIALVRGEGARVFDAEGREYIDLLSNLGASLLGHGREDFAQALADQASQIHNVHSVFYSDTRRAFLEALHELLPSNLGRSFLCSTGTESVEAAFKFARLLTGRTQIISAKRGYHGRTFGSLSATAIPKYQKAFHPLVPGFDSVPYDDLPALAEQISKETAAVILEPIQGEAGARIPDDAYLAGVRRLCDELGVLLILDEVQTGFRTGAPFAFTAMQVEPDILTLSKGLGNGFPLAATVVRTDLAARIPSGSHGTTFGSNPLACAAGLFTLNVLQKENLFEHSREVGDYFMERLKALNSPKIREVRGRGLMLAIELNERGGRYVKALQQRGVLVGVNANIIRLLPPLVLTKADVDEAMHIFSDLLS